MNILNPNATEPIVTRSIPTPDGLAQIVSLQAGWWDCLDFLVEHKGHSVQKISDFCWGLIQKTPGDSFAALFEYALHCHMMNHQAEYHHLANDNYCGMVQPSHPYRIKLRKNLSFRAG